MSIKGWLPRFILGRGIYICAFFGATRYVLGSHAMKLFGGSIASVITTDLIKNKARSSAYRIDHIPAIQKKTLSAVTSAVLALGMNSLWAAADPIVLADLTTFSIEQLMEMEVSSASKFPQKVSEAPAAVTIITAADIKSQGYRTLADILRSIRGLYVTYDRNYSYIGARGFGRPGDYNTRILFLLDGNRLNDNVFDLGLIGTESIIDTELIERVEFVPGPGSAVYGNNAFFGVVNVITKKPQQMEGLEVAGEVASYGTHKERITYGHQLDNGMEFAFSGSVYRSKGENQYFPEFDDPTTNNGVAEGLDYDRYQRLFAKFGGEKLAASVAYSDRTKGVPTAAFSQAFNDSRSHTIDTMSSINLNYNDNFGKDLDLLVKMYHGQYDYRGDYIYTTGPSRDKTKARWWGTEVRLISTYFMGHKLLSGMEYQWNPHQDQYAFYTDTNVDILNAPVNSHQYGMYIQDEYTWSENLLFNAGLRRDRDTLGQTHLNPRLAAIYKVSPRMTLKALYGTAYRAPNAYERFYFAGTGPLDSEKIKTIEGVVEHYVSDDTRLSLSIYHYDIENLIELDRSGGLFFTNLGKASANGVEMEGEHHFENDARFRASYAWQNAKDVDTNVTLDNSPKHLAKLNFTTPTFSNAFQTGIELQYTSERKTYLGDFVGGFVVANLTLTSTKLAKNTEIYASIYNLFGKQYSDPPSDEHIDELGRPLTGIRQNGRNFRLGLAYKF